MKGRRGRYGSDGYGRSEQFSYASSYTPGGLVTAKRLRIVKTTQTEYNPVSTITDLDLNYTYDQEGRMVTMKYPGAAGLTLTYGFDTMRRPVSLVDNASPAVTWVSGVSYNAAGLMTQIQSQSGNGESKL